MPEIRDFFTNNYWVGCDQSILNETIIVSTMYTFVSFSSLTACYLVKLDEQFYSGVVEIVEIFFSGKDGSAP